jgi:hypothetical protein
MTGAAASAARDAPRKHERQKPMAIVTRKVFKYPSEDECFVRRLGSGVLAVWPDLPAELKDKILAEAALAWDREYNVKQLPQKLAAMVQRYPGRLA